VIEQAGPRAGWRRQVHLLLIRAGHLLEQAMCRWPEAAYLPCLV